ncbi:hypothetical protein M3649_03705 [Ureibacillus chungkukjangi]|uniref:hypothetical protein n=1 Tax=Ureibacillus chungkukjangi TaxID=1202712 RepID=UPI00203A86DE|nr:hypothetical protein [Ureibacillus chungkukjangi]MCM3387236.1 hypothetical protein [Ureibacillus chungkukjangi]
MKDGKTQKDLAEVLSKYARTVLKNKHVMTEVSSHLAKKHNIKLGRIMYYLNDPARFSEGELSEVALIAEQIFLKLDEAEDLEPKRWFNPIEIKRFRQYKFVSIDDIDKIELPLTFDNAVYLGSGVYQVAVKLTTIARLYKYKLLHYNFNIQREGKFVKGKTEQEIKVYRKNVNEIKKEVLEGELDKTALAYNCAVDTSEDESERELIYDKENHTLTITVGTVIDILDGTHRTMGIYEAYLENPDKVDDEEMITILFSNYIEDKAKKYQVSLAKSTPFNKARAKELAKERLSDELVGRLKDGEGMLKKRIYSTNNVNRSFGQLTSFEVLSDAFDNYWRPEKRSEIKDIVKEFNEYLEYLFDYYEDRVFDDNSLLFSKLFFIGHVIVAKHMYENNISYGLLNEYFDNIDFNKNNQQWQKRGIVNSDNKIRQDKRTIKSIEEYFKNLIKEGVNKHVKH